MLINSNNNKFHITNIITSILALLLSGAMFQTFLMEWGFSDRDVNILTSLFQFFPMLATLLLSSKIDRLKNIIKIYSVLNFAAIPLILLLTAMSLSGNLIPKNLLFILLLITGLIFSFSYSLFQIVAFKLVYHIMNVNDYGRVVSISGALSGIIIVVFSATISYLQKIFGYFPVMEKTFFFLLLLVPLFWLTAISFKKMPATESTETESHTSTNILKYPPFYMLLIPNLLRGFCLGIITLAVTIGYHENVLDTHSSSILVIITNITTILGCVIYSKITRFSSEFRMIFLSSIFVAISMPLMFIRQDTNLFLLFYTIAYFFIIIINYAIPAVVLHIVDYNLLGQYSSWRLLVNAAGIAIAGFVCSPMLDLLGGFTTLLIAGLMQLVSGIAYYLYAKKEM